MKYAGIGSVRKEISLKHRQFNSHFNSQDQVAGEFSPRPDENLYVHKHLPLRTL